MIEKAVRSNLRLRMAIAGPSGSGKTATSLLFATHLARHYGGRVGVIDTERGRSLAYVDTEWAPEGFDVFQLKTTSTDGYRNAIKQFAAKSDCKVLVIDSLSHAWAGEGGLLEVADDRGDDIRKWQDIGKMQNKLINEIIGAPLHIICTMRSKTEWLIRSNQTEGKSKISAVDRVGTVPIQRKGVEYEFNIFCQLDKYHTLSVEKTDCSPIDRLEIASPREEFILPIIEWLDTGNTLSTIEAIGRKCRPDQVREWYDLVRAVGLSSDEAVAVFARKYGSRPEACSEDFLEEKLIELREKVKVRKKFNPQKRDEPASQSTLTGPTKTESGEPNGCKS